MRRNTLNFLVDAVILLAMFVMIGTGLIIRFVLPPGTGGRHGGHGLALWGMGRHDWGDVHFWTSVVLAVLFIVHVALHWSWVCSTLRRLVRPDMDAGSSRASRCNAYGFVFFGALLIGFGGFTWYATNAVVETDSAGHEEHGLNDSEAGEPGHDAHEDHGIAHDLVRGSMSLSEVAATTGVSLTILKSELGLPADTPDDERLGRLGRHYGFDMEKVRDIVAAHMIEGESR